MQDFKSSRTKVNLMRAFAGESQARNRYTFAEAQARQMNYFALADLFKFTASQEKAHAQVFYDHLKSDQGDTIHIEGGYPVDISDNVEIWICLNCGYILEGHSAPEKCPVCGVPQGYYVSSGGQLGSVRS